jgi:hypothetical protein
MLYLRPVQRPEGGSPTTGLVPRNAGNLSGGHSHTRNKLQRTNWKDPKDNNHGNGHRNMIKDIKVATWNIRVMNHKLDELIMELENRNIDVAVITETKKKNKGPKEIGNFIIIYPGVPDGK